MVDKKIRQEEQRKQEGISDIIRCSRNTQRTQKQKNETPRPAAGASAQTKATVYANKAPSLRAILSLQNATAPSKGRGMEQRNEQQKRKEPWERRGVTESDTKNKRTHGTCAKSIGNTMHAPVVVPVQRCPSPSREPQVRRKWRGDNGHTTHRKQKTTKRNCRKVPRTNDAAAVAVNS